MPTCARSIQNKIDADEVLTITELFPSTITPISFNATIKQLFRLESSKIDTAIFTIALQSTIPIGNIGVTITFYSYNEEAKTFQNIGSSIITEMTMTFQKDLSIGKFFICIASSFYAYTGTLVYTLAGYVSSARLFPIAYSGQNCQAILTISELPHVCDQPLFFHLVEGYLPPGLRLTLYGNIEGLLPNMDCIEENKLLSPSVNWYFNKGDYWDSWKRRWIFKVRVWIPQFLPIFLYPDIYSGFTFTVDSIFTNNNHEEEIYNVTSGEIASANLTKEFAFFGAVSYEWFCIAVINNWSWDKDHFDRLPDEIILESIEEVPDTSIPSPEEPCCEEVEPEPSFVPKPIELSSCPCEQGGTQEEKHLELFIQWYRENSSKDPSDYMFSFINNFKGSALYDRLMKETGLSEELITERQRTEQAEEQASQERLSAQIEGRNVEDYDYIMLSMRDKENEKLPITLYSTSGEILRAKLC